jgi:hypothetical protein
MDVPSSSPPHPSARPPEVADGTRSTSAETFSDRRAWRSPSGILVVLATLAAAIVPAVLWPGEISWTIDEPQLFARAFHANAAGTLAARGLRGNFGVSYGPAATQIYQAMLLVSHDPYTLAVLRGGLCAALTALGLLWLARSLRLNPWFAAALVLAPYLWVFQRILWDASFAIPIGTVALAAYASFLRTGGAGPLLLSLVCTLSLPFIHPQDLPLCAPILGHLLWRHRPALRRNAIGVLCVVLFVLGLNAGYFLHLSGEITYYLAVGLPPSYPGGHSLAATLLGPIGLDRAAEWAAARLGQPPAVAAAGRHILGGQGYMGYGRTELGPFVDIGKYGLYVLFPLLWTGIAVAAWRILKPPGERGAPAGGDGRSLFVIAARDAIAGIALAGVALQMLMAGATRVPAEPQYFFGTFVLHALLAWIGVDALARVRLGHAAVLAYGLSAASVTLGTMWNYHRPPPAAEVTLDPAETMPTLGDSIGVARVLARYPADVRVVTDINFYHRFPPTLRTLRLLIPPGSAGDHGAPFADLLIRFRPASDGSGPRVQVVEIGSVAEIPPDALPIRLSPLPAKWEPGKD